MSGDDYTIPEVARILRVHESTVRRWIAEGAMKAKPLPTRPGQKHIFHRVERKEVEKFSKGEE